MQYAFTRTSVNNNCTIKFAIKYLLKVNVSLTSDRIISKSQWSHQTSKQLNNTVNTQVWSNNITLTVSILCKYGLYIEAKVST